MPPHRQIDAVAPLRRPGLFFFEIGRDRPSLPSSPIPNAPLKSQVGLILRF
ncbi:hypothetical protein [Nostoc sp. FACHB-892]|uniref:hypothetical protein n=1 Tax=Nostoc sp. FACHB-892 TaxID=2692843 RepID=UPI00168376CD|nr:hypothetical protein [Nostoc sp. FACHB-892]